MLQFSKVSPSVWLAIGASFCLFTIGLIGYYVFDFSVAGVSHVIGSLIGGFLICFLIGFFANGKNLSRTLFGVCLTISSISQLHANFPEIMDAIELKKGRAILNDAQDINSILRISEKNTDNKYVKFIYEILKFKIEQKEKLEKFFSEISIDEIECIKSVENYNFQKFRDCQGYFARKIAEQRLALKSLDLVLRDIETGEKNMVSLLAKDVLRASSSTMRLVENGLKIGQATARSRVEKLMRVLMDYTEALNMFFSYISTIQGKAEVNNKKIVFNDPVAMERYNNLQNKLSLAAGNLAEVVADYEKNQDLKIMNLLR